MAAKVGRRALAWGLVLLGIGITVSILCFGWIARVATGPQRTFDGKSADLRQTVIVPTLDTPVPEGKSAIWCSTIQLCWDRLRTDVVKEPPVIRGAEIVSARLNAGKQSEADLPADSFYAAAGLVKEGIVDKIRTDMANKFPGSSPENFDNLPDLAALAFSYLETGVAYRHS